MRRLIDHLYGPPGWARHIIANQERIMADLTELNQAIADLTAKVQAEATVDASAVTLIQGMVAQLKGLADQIAALQAGSITPQQISDLASQVRGQATALDQGTQNLAAAVAANTTAASS
jgi:phage I-like protein